MLRVYGLYVSYIHTRRRTSCNCCVCVCVCLCVCVCVVQAYIAQYEGRQFGGLHTTDTTAATAVADFLDLEDLETLRREPTISHKYASQLFREMFGIYAFVGTPRHPSAEHL